LVGVGVMIRRGPLILLGKRLSGPGAGCYGWAGGHLEFGETPEACAVREVAEETGLAITQEMLVPLCVSNTTAYGSHYIDIEFRCEILDGQPRVMEPEKLESWDWYPLGAMPAPMFEAAAMALKAMARGDWWTTSD
jgi:8-oxo-dGTP diphosphatase